jgi:hypothetical protein
MELHFVRHGEYEGRSPNKELTPRGIEQINQIKQKYFGNINEVRAEGFFKNNLRSRQTVAILLSNQSRLESLDCLGYRNFNLPKLEQKFTQACNQGRNLEFLVRESDKYLSKLDKSESLVPSTYKVIFQDGLMLLRQHLTTNQNLQNLVSQKVFCCNEFIWAGFRAGLTEQSQGNFELQNYVNWYTKNIENNKQFSRYCGKVNLINNQVKLTDHYGELKIEINSI